MTPHWIDTEEEKRANTRATILLVGIFSAVAGAIFNEIVSEKMETPELTESAATALLGKSASKAVFISTEGRVFHYPNEKEVSSVAHAKYLLEKIVDETGETHWMLAADAENKEIGRVKCTPRFWRKPLTCTVYAPAAP